MSFHSNSPNTKAMRIAGTTAMRIAGTTAIWIAGMAAIGVIGGGCQQVPGLAQAGLFQAGDASFPFIEGGKWTYNVLSDTTVLGQVVEDQSLVTTQGGLTTAHLRLSGNVPIGDAKVMKQIDVTLRKTDADIQSVDDKGNATLLFKLPLVAGTTWTTGDSTLKVVGNDDVSVPAGAYRGALLIQAENKDAMSQVWLAAGTGVVKLQIAPKSKTPTIKLELTDFKR